MPSFTLLTVHILLILCVSECFSPLLHDFNATRSKCGNGLILIMYTLNEMNMNIFYMGS